MKTGRPLADPGSEGGERDPDRMRRGERGIGHAPLVAPLTGLRSRRGAYGQTAWVAATAGTAIPSPSATRRPYSGSAWVK